MRNFVDRVNENLKRRAAQRYSPEHAQYNKSLTKWFIISSVVSVLINCIYMAILVLVLFPNIEEHIISEANRFPDRMTPRLNFLNVDYDNKERRAKSVVIDVGICAGIILIELDLSDRIDGVRRWKY
jgi:hypothetical protein